MNVRWRAQIPGSAAIGVLGLDPCRESVYVADGWGVRYAALRLRRLDIANGNELAGVRLGNVARCIAFHDDALLAATDTKLFRLEPEGLEILHRWDRRVPRYANAIFAVDDRLLLANWKSPRIALVHLGKWRVQRFDVGESPLLLPVDDRVVLAYSRDEGTVSRIDLSAEAVRPVRTIDPGPCVDATLGAGLLWVLRGTFTTTTTSGRHVEVAPGPPAHELVGCDVDAGTVVHEVRIEPARRIAFGRTRSDLWTANGAIEIRRLPHLGKPARFRLPPGENAVEVFPDAGVAFTTVAGGSDSTALACVAVG